MYWRPEGGHMRVHVRLVWRRQINCNVGKGRADCSNDVGMQPPHNFFVGKRPLRLVSRLLGKRSNEKLTTKACRAES